MRFYAHESCGQCTPCREGSGWTIKILNRIMDGMGRRSDLDLLLEGANGINDAGQIAGYGSQIGPGGQPFGGGHAFLLTPRIPAMQTSTGRSALTTC